MRINPGEIYAVTPDGMPNFSWLADVVFLEPGHLWRAEWLPETAGQVHLVRDDDSNPSNWGITAQGLLGVAIHAVHGKFRMVRPAELLAAATAVAEQMSRCHPPTSAVVEVPHGFTVHVVPPALVFGPAAAHDAALRELAPRP